MIKRIISFICALCLALSLAACAKKQAAQAPETLKEKIPNAYVGDVDVQQKIKIGQLNIVLKDTIFFINDIEFAYSEFKNEEKLSTNMGKDMLDVYVKGGKLQKCVVTSADLTTVTTYNIAGKATSMTKATIDAYGNRDFVAYYDSEGNLERFYTAIFDKVTMLEKREYNAAMDLTAVIKYEYDESGKCKREIIYDADLHLKEVKTY